MRNKIWLLASALLAASASAQSTPDYIFAHGLSNQCEIFFGFGGAKNESTTCDAPADGSFAARLKTGGNANARMQGRTIQTKTIGIGQQGQQLAQDLSGANPKVLIGHSQGALRARWALQKLPGQIQNIRAFISVAGPNAGAPVVLNGPAFASRMYADLTTSGVITAAKFFLPMIGVSLAGINIDTEADAMATIQQFANVSFQDPGFKDLAPNSNLLFELNIPGNYERCQWVVTWYGTYQQICQAMNAVGLDPSIAVASIRGKNNMLFGGLVDPNARGDFNNALEKIRWHGYAMQAGCRGSFGFWRAACNSMEASWRVTWTMENIETVFQRDIVGAEGASNGDGTVPLRSQSIRESAPWILSGQDARDYDVEEASHGGYRAILGRTETVHRFREIQAAMNLPVTE